MTNKETLVEILEEVKWIKKFLLDSLPPDHIIISCDGSITENPGGRCAVGVVIQVPDLKPIEQARFTRAKTNNQVEMDAIYEGLTTLYGLNKVPRYDIEVVSDSRICINGLNKPDSLHDDKLKRRRDLILILVAAIPAKITFTWKKRNSTRALAAANRLAQELNGVENK